MAEKTTVALTAAERNRRFRDGKKTIRFSLEEGTHALLKAKSAKETRSIRAQCIYLIRQFVGE